MSDIEHSNIEANGVRFHVATAGDGPPVYLLHGWPQTSYCWHRIIPALAERYTVVAPDQRGFGYSSKPDSGYDAHTLGDDIAALARVLGHEGIAVVGHDWGGTPAYSVAARHRDLVRSLTMLDTLLPGFRLYNEWMIPKADGQFIWHQAFMSVPEIPEMLIRGHERDIISWFFTAYTYDPTAVTQEEVDFYEHTMKLPGALRGGIEWYRAWFQSAEQIAELVKDKLDIPVLALGGEVSCNTMTLENMQEVATDVRGGVVERCGHWMVEERAEHMIELLTAFLDETSTTARTN